MDPDTPEPLADLVARVDPDRYVAALFAPSERRAALMALYAFDHEVARIAEIVHEPLVGHIRLGWWREQIAAIYAGADAQAPVAKALAATVRAHTLPREVFETYLDARAHDFEEAPFADDAAFERYAVAVSGGIMRLAALVLGGGGEAAARHAGIAFAYARLRPKPAAAAEHALSELARLSYPRRIVPALAPAATARWIVRNGGRAPPPWLRVARIAWASLTGRI